MQFVKRIGLLSPAVCPAVQYFSTLSKPYDFRKKSYWTWKVCFNFLYIFCWSISPSKKNWARYDQKCILVFM